MSFDHAPAALEKVLGHRPAKALTDWAATMGRTVRPVLPNWTAHGYTGARLLAVNVRTPGESDVQLIVKVCPPGPFSRETAAHNAAKIHSDPGFFDSHLVKQLFDPYPVGNGGYLMFQEIAGGLLTFKSLSALPEDLLPTACEIVARSVLMDRTIRTPFMMDTPNRAAKPTPVETFKFMPRT